MGDGVGKCRCNTPSAARKLAERASKTARGSLVRKDAITRRSFVMTVAGGLAAAALPLHAAAKLNVGIGTYSYHNLSMEEMIVQLRPA
jgi:hypothetical protein